MGHYPNLHSQLQSKRSYDFSAAMMDPSGNPLKGPPVTLSGDPYLNEHARQASHDSGLGYPYQSEQNMMDFDEGFDGGLHTIPHMGSNPGLVPEHAPHGGSHPILDQLQTTPEIDHQHPQMDFCSDMLGDFTVSQNVFSTNTWV
jgi:hypothetical protein